MSRIIQMRAIVETLGFMPGCNADILGKIGCLKTLAQMLLLNKTSIIARWRRSVHMNKDLNKRCEEVRTVPVTDRVRRLRQAVLDAKPILCSERALIVTKCYQETEGMHFIERRARALYRILDEMTLRIWDGELLVGTLGTNG